MSRVAKMPVVLPKAVEITASGQQVTVKGPKGTLSHTIHDLVEMVRGALAIPKLLRMPARVSISTHWRPGCLSALYWRITSQ